MSLLKRFRAAGLAALLISAGCIAPAPYQALVSGKTKSGYAVQKISDDKFRVIFVGNSTSGAKRVSDYALLRAAELALKNQLPYFVMVKQTPATRLDDVQPSAIFASGGGPTSPSDSASDSSNVGGGGSPPAPGAILDLAMIDDVQCYANPPESKPDTPVYDARRISAELRKKYSVDQATSS